MTSPVLVNTKTCLKNSSIKNTYIDKNMTNRPKDMRGQRDVILAITIVNHWSLCDEWQNRLDEWMNRIKLVEQYGGGLVGMECCWLWEIKKTPLNINHALEQRASHKLCSIPRIRPEICSHSIDSHTDPCLHLLQGVCLSTGMYCYLLYIVKIINSLLQCPESGIYRFWSKVIKNYLDEKRNANVNDEK